MSITTLTLRIEKTQERSYFTQPFTVPEGTVRVDLAFGYKKNAEEQNGEGLLGKAVNSLDFGLEAADGTFLGWSGGARSHLWVSGTDSTPGYPKLSPPAGEWKLLLGAYNVAEEGVELSCEITLTPGSRRLYKGDTHLHTVASDGGGSLADVVATARTGGLDFICVTDHNMFASRDICEDFADITVIPGVEWTHYNGHALMLGVERPYSSRFTAATREEACALLEEGRQSGAYVALAHPFCHLVPWLWGLDVPYDGLEVWNGVMHERNEKALYYWHTLLCAGKRVPATAGSDYHRPGLLGSVAMPATCVYAGSRAPKDILNAIAAGQSYLSYLPRGPQVDIECGGVYMGGIAPVGGQTSITLRGLKAGDRVELIGAQNTEALDCGADTLGLVLKRCYSAADKFVRVVVTRCYEAGLPPMKALVSNPLYFE